MALYWLFYRFFWLECPWLFAPVTQEWDFYIVLRIFLVGNSPFIFFIDFFFWSFTSVLIFRIFLLVTILQG